MTAGSYHRALAVAGFFTLIAGDFWRYSLTWWGWGAISGVLVALWIVEMARARVDLRRMPAPLVAFLVLVVASLAWSHYPAASAAGIASTLATAVFGVGLATLLDWAEVIRALGRALRIVLAASLLFEFVVAAIIRDRVLPFFVDYSDLERIPNAFYWSRELLFEGGRIQGIQGNANLLAMAALVALVVFAVQIAFGQATRGGGAAWIGVAALCLVLTRSSTVIVAAVVVTASAVFLVLVRRAGGLRRVVAHVVALAVLAGAVVAAIVFRAPLLGLLGRSDDLTNRLDIWAAVIERITERPVAGWGWVSYWPPWVDFFERIAVIRGVTYLQAHDAWLDVLLQLGVLGLVVFGALVLSTFWRAWSLALDSPPVRPRAPRSVASGSVAPRSAALTARPATASAWPLAIAAPLLMVALLVQSLAESRLLIEWGLALLIAIAVATRDALAHGQAVGEDAAVPGAASTSGTMSTGGAGTLS